MVNPVAPGVYSGIQTTAATPEGYLDVGFDYVYDVVLTALQVRADAVAISNDADFVLRALCIQVYTSVFSLQLSDSNGYLLSNAALLSTNLLGDAAAPYPMEPELWFPAAGRIGVNIADVSNAGNTIQIIFRGVKRYWIGK